METQAQPTPPPLTPYLTVDGAHAAIDFYKRAFGAEEISRAPIPGGKLVHAEIKIGDSRVMLTDEFPKMHAVSPRTLKATPLTMYCYVKDCDALFDRAVKAGAKVLHPMTNQFYGDRCGALEDPFGHKWMIATHVEDVPPKEMEKRTQEFVAKGGCA